MTASNFYRIFNNIKKLLYIFILFPFLFKAQGIVVGDTTSPNIIYNNIKDTVVPYAIGWLPKNCDVDIDGNAILDFRFNNSYNGSPGFSSYMSVIQNLSNFEFVCTTTTTVLTCMGYPVYFADTLPINSILNSSLIWKSSQAVLSHSWFSFPNSCATGLYNVNSDKYLGFRRIAGIDTIYGWFLLNRSSPGVILKSYAYEKKCSAMPSINIISTSSIICSGETATITAYGANTFTWSTGQNISTVIITPTTTTSYSVQGTQYGCAVSGAFTQTVNACVGIEEFYLAEVNIYPNPVSKQLNIEMIKRQEIKWQQFYSMDGRKIELRQLEENIYDVSSLPEGIYFLQLKLENAVLNKKIVIQH